MNQYSRKFYVEGPRWAGWDSAVKKRAWVLGVDIALEIDKGIFCHTYRFTASGDKAQVDRLVDEVKQTVARYNNE